MKIRLSIFLLFTSLSCFSQKHGVIKVTRDPALDSIKATNLIMGTWIDTRDPLHSLTFSNKIYQNHSDNQFYEKGIKNISISYQWEYKAKDSAGKKYRDSTNVSDTLITRSNWHGTFWTAVRPLEFLSENDTDGTGVILTIVPFMNSGDVKWTERIIMLNDEYLKFHFRGKGATLFKRER